MHTVIRLRVLLLAAILAMFAGAQSTPALAGTGPHQNLVAGEAKFGDLGSQVRIHAEGDPATGVARGSFFLAQGSFQITGTVTCLKVVGNTAAAGGVIVDSSIPFLVGFGFVQFVQDNGSPGTNDRSHTGLLLSPPASCPTPVTPVFQLTQGNYVVKQGE